VQSEDHCDIPISELKHHTTFILIAKLLMFFEQNKNFSTKL
jgi:hypothetical protein